LSNDNLVSTFIPAIKIKAVNKVGCGDTFGGVFFYNYLRSKDFNSALIIANIAGGLAASYNDLQNFNNLKNDIFTRYT
jgi:sugar/nucleoside kinase (ribokinase family)